MLTNNLVYNTTCYQRGHLKVLKEATFELSFALLIRPKMPGPVTSGLIKCSLKGPVAWSHWFTLWCCTAFIHTNKMSQFKMWLLACADALRPSQQFLSHVGNISCFLRVEPAECKRRIKKLAQRHNTVSPFDLILYSPVKKNQSCLDGPSSVEPVLSRG